ncbi:MAG: hypothetical protein ACLQLG_16000 [Thermoguttaceae bacterium]
MAVVQFEFHGGCKDSLIVVGTDDMQNMDNPARAYLFLSDRGRIGARLLEIPATVELHESVREIQARIAPLGQPKKPELVDRVIQLYAEGKMIGLKHGETIRHVYQVVAREKMPDGVRIRLDFMGLDLDLPRDYRV